MATKGVVFVANGAGDFHTLSSNLGQVLQEAKVPLQIETVNWSHGYRRYLFDHVDHANHLFQGQRLATELLAYRRTFPDRRVYLVGDSAGSAVILAAAEALPPDWVNRIVLLAPSVSANHDLHPALRSARDGMDVYYSEEDRFVLGLGMQIVGTSDRGGPIAAGQFGFVPTLAGPAEAALYTRLRQHAWDPAVEWSGNNGGHSGPIQKGFLRAYVVPLLAGTS